MLDFPYNTPISNISICKNVPCDNSYKFITDILTPEAIRQYAKYNINNLTPVKNNRVRVPYFIDNLADCNYIVFSNGIRDICAFIVDIVYININCSDITFNVDAWNTYRTSVTLNPCMVLREHPINDDIATNFEPEPIPPMSYVNTMQTQISASTENMQYLLLATADSGVLSTVPTNVLNSIREWFTKVTTVDENGNIINVDYSNVSYLPDNSVNSYQINGQTFCGFLLLSDYNSVQAKLQEYGKNGTSERIIGIYQVYNASPTVLQTTTEGFSRNNTINGYSPKNKKCLQYPFQKITAVSSDGRNLEYSFDLFSSATAVFVSAWDIGLNDTVIFAPTNYNGVPWNWDMGLTNQCRSEIPYSTKGVIGNLGYKQIAQSIFGALSTIAKKSSFIAYNKIKKEQTSEVGKEVGNEVISDITELGTHVLFDAPTQGGGSDGSIMTRTNGGWLFRIFRNECRYDIVKSADDYFTRYGYATNKIKTPNINSRNDFNYVKTENCEVNGNIPMTAKQIIQNMFNNGVTIFHSLENFGKIIL